MRIFIPLLLSTLASALQLERRQAASTTPGPDQFYTPAAGFPVRWTWHLWDFRQEFLRNSDGMDALDRLATQALAAPPFTITNSPITPPSGSKNDFLSYAPFFWPNTNCTNTTTCPYVRKDTPNPDAASATQTSELMSFAGAVRVLGLKAWVNGRANNTAYVAKISQLVKTWFIDEKTRMNPNVNYGEVIRGQTPLAGRYEGIIQTRWLAFVPEVLKLMRNTTADVWADSDETALNKWYQDYLTWLTTSDLGKQARDAHNIHSTYWYGQVVTIQRYLGKHSDVANTLKEFFTVSLPAQINAAGELLVDLDDYKVRPARYYIADILGAIYLARFGWLTNPDTKARYYPVAWGAVSRGIVRAIRQLIRAYPYESAVNKTDYNEYRELLDLTVIRYGDQQVNDLTLLRSKLGQYDEDGAKVNGMLIGDEGSALGDSAGMSLTVSLHGMVMVALATFSMLLF